MFVTDAHWESTPVFSPKLTHDCRRALVKMEFGEICANNRVMRDESSNNL